MKIARSFLLIVLLISHMFVAVPTAALAISAESAILIEQSSGRILFAKQEHKQMRIASITKIMTAILAIESGKMSELVTVSPQAFGVEGSSIFLQEGEQITLEDLVYGLMLRSGNDAAVAIAEHVGGSVAGFVFMMNEKARELGMERTVFSNPHGLDDHEEHYSTAYDMALLTQYAMKNEQFRNISATKEYRSKSGDGGYRYWLNKHRLVTGLYKYATGGKTGFTKRAKRTLVSTAKKGSFETICVTLNAPSDWHDHMNLFEFAFQTYELATIVDNGLVRRINDDFYKNKLYVKNEFIYPLSEKERQSLKKKVILYRSTSVSEKEALRQPVGKITVTLHDQFIKDVPLYYLDKENNEKVSIWKRLLQFFTKNE